MSEFVMQRNGMVMPSRYVKIEREEMTYIEGGYQGVFNKVNNVGRALDCIAIGLGVGAAIKSKAALKALLKSNAGQSLTRKLKREIIEMFGSNAGKIFVGAVDIVCNVTGTSLGTMFAKAIDKIDTRPNSGYLFD